MPPHDPHVQDAAQHALRTIQQRSNSLLPYELLEIVHAKAEVSALWFFCIIFCFNAEVFTTVELIYCVKNVFSSCITEAFVIF